MDRFLCIMLLSCGLAGHLWQWLVPVVVAGTLTIACLLRMQVRFHRQGAGHRMDYLSGELGCYFFIPETRLAKG